MKTTKIIATVALASMLLAATPAFAHGDKGEGSRGKNGFHLGIYMKEWKEKFRNLSETEKKELKETIKEKRSHFSAGVVTSVSGSTFVLDPIGKKKATTTVSTTGSTVFKVNGQATTSSALQVGSKVFLVGTTTATSTAGDTFTASIVTIITRGFGHVKHWFWFR